MVGSGHGFVGCGRAGGRGGHLCGLVSRLDRKNGWTFAEHAGDVSPDGMQRLVRRADLGASTRSETTYGTMWSSISATPTVCWSSTTPAFVKRGIRSAGGGPTVPGRRRPDRELPGGGLPGLPVRQKDTP